jgi:DNA topoisomerase I
MQSSSHLRVARPVRRVDDGLAGIRRLRAGRGFTYRWPDGRRVADADVLGRIRALAIPPAWTDVWICASPDGHLQATGRDARGRKQYRYHADWRAARELAKFGALADFGLALPAIRRARDRDLCRGDVSPECVTAAVVSLLERTMIRVGNEEYVRENGHFGLTTLRSRHVRLGRNGTLTFSFVGKSGVAHRLAVTDPRIAALVARCRRLPGEHLFQYRNGGGATHPVTSGDVNAYLRAAADAEVTAKDFRTWLATLQAVDELTRLEPPSSSRDAARSANVVIDNVAACLANTRSVCRASYIHPAVLHAYADGTLNVRWERATPARVRGLTAIERRLVALLRALESGRTRFARAA